MVDQAQEAQPPVDPAAQARASAIADYDAQSGPYAGRLYDSGFTAGVASVVLPAPADDVQKKIDDAVAAAKADMQPAMDALKKQVSDESAQVEDVQAHEKAIEQVLADLKAKIKAIIEG